MELVQGILIEKTYDFRDSLLTGDLLFHLSNHAAEHRWGIVVRLSGPITMAAGIVRLPDVACFAWSRFKHDKIPDEPIPCLVPDFAKR